MTRKEFIRICGLLGVGIPIQGIFPSCDKDPLDGDFDGKVIIIGAGAAGLSAGYLLQQLGVEFEILEASSNYGGRTKRTLSFADFPIPLGAEWLHVGPEVLDEIVNDSAVLLEIATTPYDAAVDFGLFEGTQITVAQAGFNEDRKFINSSWFDFFETYIVPSVEAFIQYNTVVEAVDYSGSQIQVKAGMQTYTADKIIVNGSSQDA